MGWFGNHLFGEVLSFVGVRVLGKVREEERSGTLFGICAIHALSDVRSDL